MNSFLKRLLGRETQAEKDRRIFMANWKPYNQLDRITYGKFCDVEEGETYEITNWLTCAESVHEWNKYPRPGIKIERLKPGDKVIFLKEYRNHYGVYYNLKDIVTGRVYSIEWLNAAYSMIKDKDSLKEKFISMCKEFDKKKGKVTIEYSLRPEELEYFIECTKDVSELGMWIFFPCDTCAKHAEEENKLWLHASLVKKTDMEGLI